MTAFNYSALDSKGLTKTGILEGDSPRHIRQQLREQGLMPLDVIAITKKYKFRWTHKKHLKVIDLALLTRQLATLLAAGLPLEECLLSISEQADKAYIKSIIHGVRSHVLEGHSLANAMRYFPDAFSELYCATVAAGEQTGHLDIVLNRLADYTEQQQEMRQKIQQALIYPSLMTVISIAIVTFLLVFVVPKIIAVFASTGQTLPEATQLLILISNLIRRYGLLILLFFLGSLIAVSFLKKQLNFRYKLHHFLLRLPLLNYMIKQINTARFARTFGILTTAGVPVLEAMRVSATLVTNLIIKDAIHDATKRVKEGAHIHFALRQTHYFSPMTLHLIANGENSGRLAEMLERAANNQENEINRLITTGLTLLEPIIIIIMGAIVLFIVLAILLPIFELDQLIV